MTSLNSSKLTKLLNAAGAGSREAANQLFRIVYPRLREIAVAKIGTDGSLQPTAIVNEALARILNSNALERTANRGMFFAYAATTIRSVLVDLARKRKLRPHADQSEVVHPDEISVAFERHERLNVLELDEVLVELQSQSERKYQIVMLHFFGGLTFREIAEHLNVSLSTVEKDWKFARAWLRRKLNR